jgi:hypothetical protein
MPGGLAELAARPIAQQPQAALRRNASAREQPGIDASSVPRRRSDAAPPSAHGCRGGPVPRTRRSARTDRRRRTEDVVAATIPRDRPKPPVALERRTGRYVWPVWYVERRRRLVGDQHSGFEASAIAIITRWRIPPELVWIREAGWPEGDADLGEARSPAPGPGARDVCAGGSPHENSIVLTG